MANSDSQNQQLINLVNEQRLKELAHLKEKRLGNFSNPVCDACISYYEKERGGHRIDCIGIPEGDEWVPQEVRPYLTDEEIATAIIINDPVQWISTHFGMKLYDYQKEFLWCTARTKACRWGRRCVTGDAKILMSDMSYRFITDVKPGDEVVAFTESNPVKRKITKFFENGKRDIYRVRLANGLTLDCTDNHPFLVVDYNFGMPTYNWVSISNGLRRGHKAVVFSPTSRKATLYNPVFRPMSIIDIKYLGVDDTFDITVEKSHNFIANSIVTHNSGKTTACVGEMLHGCITQTGVPFGPDGERHGCRILVVAPQQSQIDTVFEMVDQYLSLNAEIASTVVSRSRNPQRVEFTNGSWILGKPAGTKANSKSLGIRSKGADRIYLDEADYLTTGDYTTITPIMSDHSETRLSLTSTPSGMVSDFYNYCTSNTAKEFHIPSHRRPNWTKQMEEDSIGRCATYLEYQLEYLAEWGRSASGVFPVSLVNESLMDFAYPNDVYAGPEVMRFSYDPRWIYILGADQNEKTGLVCVVLGYNTENGHFYIVDRRGVDKSDYTQVKSMELLIQTNRIWNPKFIYMDQGPSMTAIEVLLQWSQRELATGRKSPDARISYILKAVDFGAKSDSPTLDGGMTKRRNKPFIIGLAARKFEEHNVKLSKFDKILIQQLVDLQHEKSAAGNLVFKEGPKGDHAVVAMSLAFYGFAMEYTEYGYGTFDSSVAIAPGFGVTEPQIEKNMSKRELPFVSLRESFGATKNPFFSASKVTQKQPFKTNLRRYK